MAEGTEEWLVARVDGVDIFWRDDRFFTADQPVPKDRIREWDRSGRLEWLAKDERAFLLREGIPGRSIPARRETVWHLVLFLALAAVGQPLLALISPYVIDETPYAAMAVLFLWLSPLALLWYLVVAWLYTRMRGVAVSGTIFFCFLGPFVASLVTGMLFASSYKAGPEAYAYLVQSGAVAARRAALLPLTSALWILAFALPAVARPWLPGDPLISPATETEARRRTAAVWLMVACVGLAVVGYVILAALGLFPA